MAAVGKETKRKVAKEMVHFLEKREAAGLKQMEAVKALCAAGGRFDRPLLSKIENGRCLPMPPDAQVMCEVYGVGMLELADAEDITYLPERPKKTVCVSDEKRYYKLTARLDLELASALIEALRQQDAGSVTAWVTRCAKRFVKRAQKKSAACAATQTTHAEKNNMLPVV